MRGRRKERIEAVVDRAAAFTFAAAVAFGLLSLLADRVAQPNLSIVAAAGGLFAYFGAVLLLRRVSAGSPTFDVPAFAQRQFEFEDLGELLLTEEVELLLTEQVELVLTDADRVKPARTLADELVLDDILAKLAPQSRVVRLFDPAAMPTAGQLNARIAQHLQGETSVATESQDASQALYQALSELRRSLR